MGGNLYSITKVSRKMQIIPVIKSNYDDSYALKRVPILDLSNTWSLHSHNTHCYLVPLLRTWHRLAWLELGSISLGGSNSVYRTCRLSESCAHSFNFPWDFLWPMIREQNLIKDLLHYPWNCRLCQDPCLSYISASGTEGTPV